MGEKTLATLLLVVVVISTASALSVLSTTIKPYIGMVDDKIVVAVDLAHGENDKMLSYIMGNITWVEWRKINSTFTSDLLADIDVLIIGQPTVAFSPDELIALKNWLKRYNKVLWVAGDSDYGTGPQTIDACNTLLEYINAKLRLENGAVYDNVNNAGAYYRVLTRVAPDNISELYTDMLTVNITKPILMHGPDALIWVDEQGVYHNPMNETFPGMVRIVWSYNTSYIGDNQPPANIVYDQLNYGQGTGNWSFVMVAGEYWNESNNLIIVSGESPYGDYQPMYSWVYYGVKLDGPQFVKNMILWFEKIIRTYYKTPPITEIGEITDPEGDDKGTGTIVYPTNAVFRQSGIFDLLKFGVYMDDDYVYFKVTLKNIGGNPWNGPNGFSFQHIQIYMLTTDDTLPHNVSTIGLNAYIWHGWNYVLLMVPGWDTQAAPAGQLSALYDANNNLLAVEKLNSTLDVYLDPELNNTITAKVAKTLLRDLNNIGNWVFVVAVAGYDGYKPTKIRPVLVNATEWEFGGGDPQAVNASIQPYIIDLLAPTPDDQYNVLKSYNVVNKTFAIIGGVKLSTGQLQTPPHGWVPPTTPPATSSPPTTSAPTRSPATSISPTTSPLPGTSPVTTPPTTSAPTRSPATTTPAGDMTGVIVAVVIIIIILIIVVALVMRKK